MRNDPKEYELRNGEQPMAAVSFRALSQLLLAIVIGHGWCSFVMAGNFLCADAEVVAAAESARIRSARFWTGTSLPGRWSTPCPITVWPAAHAGGGRTQFQFEGGEVFGWRMSISGTRSAILQDVIPHEVDHMVRASLVRRPIERWLDEGCASLMESPAVHQRLRLTASGLNPAMITTVWLSDNEYPNEAVEIDHLYALGFSLVEFLLTRDSAAALLEFQRDPRAIPVRLKQHYGLTVETLRAGWAGWMQQRPHSSCADGGCAIHPKANIPAPAPSVSDKPLLIVWTASWCGPCQQFKADLAANAKFRKAIKAAFQIRFRDFDQEPKAAAAAGVQSLPTFILPNNRWSGYQSAEDLLQRLQALTASESSSSVKPPVEAVPASDSPKSKSKSTKPTTRPTTKPTTKPTASSVSREEQGTTSPPAQRRHPGVSLLGWIPITLTALQWAGVIGGSVATGGVGGLAIALATAVIKRRLNRKSPPAAVPTSTSIAEGSAAVSPAPFPRALDEASELLELRQSEGRVATLDALRGMFLDDELDKLEQSSHPGAAEIAVTLRNTIDDRIDEVAPLTTSV